MMTDLHLLKKNDGWKELSEVTSFLKAVSSIPDLGDKTLVDKNYFIDAPGCFFKHSNEMFMKHVAKNVLTNDIVVYLIGGNPTLAQMLLNWLAVAEDNQDMDGYVFPSEQSWLGT